MTEEKEVDPLGGVIGTWFSQAKSWWGTGLVVQASVATAGCVAVILDSSSGLLALLVSAATVVGSVALWRADHLRLRAESLLRHMEFRSGFGWPIDPKLLADTVTRALAVEALVKSRLQEQGVYYASQAPLGSQRVLENLSESAWWTQQLAEYMGRVSLFACALLGLVSLWSLLVAASVVGSGPVIVSAVVISVVALLLSSSLARLPIEYLALAAQAKNIDERATGLLSSGSISERDALRLLNDYQLTRVTAQPIPDWAWRRRRDALNQIWKQYRGIP